MDIDHVVAQNTPEGGQRFLCKHCGTHYDPSLPCPMNVFLAAMDAFGKSHADCPPPNPPEQGRVGSRY